MWDMGITCFGGNRAIRFKAFRFKRNGLEKEVLATLSGLNRFPVNRFLRGESSRLRPEILWKAEGHATQSLRHFMMVPPTPIRAQKRIKWHGCKQCSLHGFPAVLIHCAGVATVGRPVAMRAPELRRFEPILPGRCEQDRYIERG